VSESHLDNKRNRNLNPPSKELQNPAFTTFVFFGNLPYSYYNRFFISQKEIREIPYAVLYKEASLNKCIKINLVISSITVI